MPTYVNTVQSFGDYGPYEAESKEAIIAEADDMLYDWACSRSIIDDRSIMIHLNELRAEMHSALRECRYFRASDGCETLRIDAADMDSACEIAHNDWLYAEPGTYDVTVWEFADEETRNCASNSSSDIINSRTITVVSQ